MQSAADFIGSFVELSSGMQYSHDDLQCRLVKLFVFVHWYSSSVVLYGNRLVLVYGHFDMCAISSHCLVDRVVYGFIHKMVQTLLADVSDIHRRALSHGLKSLEHLYITRGIIAFFDYVFCHFNVSQNYCAKLQ